MKYDEDADEDGNTHAFVLWLLLPILAMVGDGSRFFCLNLALTLSFFDLFENLVAS